MVHDVCTACDQVIGFCERVEIAREQAAAAAGLCFACELAPSTTTCGVPRHPCKLCLNCRLSLDGLEYYDLPQTPAEGARLAGAEDAPALSESAPTTTNRALGRPPIPADTVAPHA